MANALVIGMGIGNLYKGILTNLGYDVTTVDLRTGVADFESVDKLPKTKKFEVAVICTPNFTHEPIARQIADKCKIVLIEKPGLRTATEWQQLIDDFPKTRIMMVKNNMWRTNIDELRKRVNNTLYVQLNWVNQNRVPNPGTWFTTKEKAFGGVSRDLMTHLLSLFVALEPNYDKAAQTTISASRRYELHELIDTDYGVVDANGTYDVDDYSHFTFDTPERQYRLTADWKSGNMDDRSIYYKYPDAFWSFELGLCPEEAYQAMIADAVQNLKNDDWWLLQLQYDLWIHRKVEQF